MRARPSLFVLYYSVPPSRGVRSNRFRETLRFALVSSVLAHHTIFSFAFCLVYVPVTALLPPNKSVTRLVASSLVLLRNRFRFRTLEVQCQQPL